MEGKHKILIFARKGSMHHADEIVNLFPGETIIDSTWRPSIIDQTNPDLVITFDEHYCELTLCVIHAKRKGIPILLIRDGILESRFLDFESNEITKRNIRSVFISDKIACLGENDKRIIESWGNNGKGEAIGSSRIDRIITDFTLKNNLNNPSPKLNLLIISAKRPYFNEREKQVTLMAFRDLKDTLSAFKDLLNVSWRVTPEIAKQLSLNARGFKESTGKELHVQLSQSDLAITTPSTAMLEAMLSNIPVAVIDYHQVERLYKAAWIITEGNQIHKTLSEMISRDKDKLLLQQELLKDQLNYEPHSHQRLIELINRMIDEKAMRQKIDEVTMINYENRGLVGVNYLLEKQNHILMKRLHRIPFYNLLVKFSRIWKS